MVHALLRRKKFEDARLLGKYWMVIFDATRLFHFKERHCPHCLEKVLDKGTGTGTHPKITVRQKHSNGWRKS